MVGLVDENPIEQCEASLQVASAGRYRVRFYIGDPKNRRFRKSVSLEEQRVIDVQAIDGAQRFEVAVPAAAIDAALK